MKMNVEPEPITDGENEKNVASSLPLETEANDKSEVTSPTKKVDSLPLIKTESKDDEPEVSHPKENGDSSLPIKTETNSVKPEESSPDGSNENEDGGGTPVGSDPIKMEIEPEVKVETEVEMDNNDTSIKMEVEPKDTLQVATQHEVENGIETGDDILEKMIDDTNSVLLETPSFEKFKTLRQNTKRKKKKQGDEYSVFGKFVAQELRSLQEPRNCKLLKHMIQKAVLQVSALDDGSKVCIDTDLQ